MPVTSSSSATHMHLMGHRAAVILALVAGAFGGALAMPSGAGATPPNIHIKTPHNGSLSNDPTPRFEGTTDYTLEEFEELHGAGTFRPVEVVIGAEGGSSVDRLTAPALPGTNWSVSSSPLPDGTYIAEATQTNYLSEVGTSEQVIFTIDTTPPAVTISSPAPGSAASGGTVTLGGSAGSAPGDLSPITVELFSGDAVGSMPLETLVVQAVGGDWSATFGGLAPGTYTAHATQRDAAGNMGASGPLTFTVSPPSFPPPPVASFNWFPPNPETGESVSLVSSSTDLASPIASYAWSLAGTGPFVPGDPVLTTSFATPGGHVVRLDVTDANGQSSIATQTIPVRAATQPLMQPFPIVRIAGSVTSSGAKVTLLTVQAPLGARVTVTCRGRGCRTRAESHLANASSRGKAKPKAPAGTALMTFAHFERSLRAGAVLKVIAAKPGQIGKYTSFTIRRHRLPVRVDECVVSTDPTPILCPS